MIKLVKMDVEGVKLNDLIKMNAKNIELLFHHDYDYCAEDKGNNGIKLYDKLDEAIRDFSIYSNEILEDIVKNGITENLTFKIELGVDGFKLMETNHKIDNWGK